MKPFKYEVDLRMLPMGAQGGDLAPFCAALERIMERGDDGRVRIVPTFQALNDGTNSEQLAWGWPTEDQWSEAIRQVFGVIPFPRK